MIGDELLHFVEYDLQAIALTWMGVLYSIKIYQLSSLPMPWEREPRKGNPTQGILHSYGSIFMPWSMESSRKHLMRWLEFGAYHVGALVAIVNTFTFPFFPEIMTQPVRWSFSLLIALAIPLGIVRLIRRITRPEMRLISTPDDYFSLISLEFFFLSAVMALMFDTPFWRMTYFLITAAFLFYVPFSKISHYIYFFFSHFLTGHRYGWRGVVPKAKSEL